jgi:hypothetical protein
LLSISAYWDQQLEKRLIATLHGVLYSNSNIANNHLQPAFMQE